MRTKGAKDKKPRHQRPCTPKDVERLRAMAQARHLAARGRGTTIVIETGTAKRFHKAIPRAERRKFATDAIIQALLKIGH